MNNLQKEGDEIFAIINKKIEYHKSMALKYRNILEAVIKEGISNYSENIMPNEFSKLYSDVSVSAHPQNGSLISVEGGNIKESFDKKVERILLLRNAPIEVKELFEQYNSKTDKKLERQNFAARMSIAVAKKKIFKLYSNQDNGKNIKYWCLSTWFSDEGILKFEYLDKIKKAT